MFSQVEMDRLLGLSKELHRWAGLIRQRVKRMHPEVENTAALGEPILGAADVVEVLNLGGLAVVLGNLIGMYLEDHLERWSTTEGG